MGKLMVFYLQLRSLWLKRVVLCQVCGCARSAEIHHTRGRAGSLLLDFRFWAVVCPTCHRAVHDNPDWARRRRLLAHPGEWDVAERDGLTVLLVWASAQGLETRRRIYQWIERVWQPDMPSHYRRSAVEAASELFASISGGAK